MLGFPVTFGHGSFTFNEHLDAAGAVDTTKVHNTVVLDRARWIPNYRDLRDPYHLAQGGALGRVHKGVLALVAEGRIEVPNATQLASMSDKVRAMRAAFDPYQAYLDSTVTDGAYPLDYTERTTDTATYPTGRILLMRYMRPNLQPTFEERLTDRTQQPWSVVLIAADPREYEQTEQTLALTIGSPSGNVVNRGTTPAPVKVTIVMSGAGASNFTITRGGVAFILDLSTMIASDSVVVVMETSAPYGAGRRITKNGTDAFSLKTSAVNTWLDGPVGTTDFTITNTTGITSCTLAWHSARA